MRGGAPSAGAERRRRGPWSSPPILADTKAGEPLCARHASPRTCDARARRLETHTSTTRDAEPCGRRPSSGARLRLRWRHYPAAGRRRGWGSPGAGARPRYLDRFARVGLSPARLGCRRERRSWTRLGEPPGRCLPRRFLGALDRFGRCFPKRTPARCCEAAGAASRRAPLAPARGAAARTSVWFVVLHARRARRTPAARCLHC